MSPRQEKVELFRALDVREVEERTQHQSLSSGCSYGGGGLTD